MNAMRCPVGTLAMSGQGAPMVSWRNWARATRAFCSFDHGRRPATCSASSAEAAAGARLLRDAIGVGAGQQAAEVEIGAALAAPAAGEGAGLVGAARTVGAETREAVCEVGLVAAEAAFGDQHGELGGGAGVVG